MKSALLAIGWALSSLSCASAQTIQDPIRDYLTSPDIDKDIAMPRMEKLYVLKCNLTNGGKPATLISFNSYGGRQGNYWTAYVPTGEGYVKATDSDTTLTFRIDTFYVGLVDGKYGLLAYAPGHGGGDLNLFQIVNGRVTEQKIASVDLSNPQDKKKFKFYFGEAPDWRSLKENPVKRVDLDELKQSGYDVDATIKAAKDATHPPYKTPSN